MTKAKKAKPRKRALTLRDVARLFGDEGWSVELVMNPPRFVAKPVPVATRRRTP